MADETEHDEIQIQGHPFKVRPRYSEGHTLNEREADVLNQTYYENLRNNFAGKVKAKKEEHQADVLPPEVHADLHREFDSYAQDYEFGVRRTSTGPSADPVEAMAMQMARQAIRDALRSQGRKLKEIDAEAIESAAEKYLAGKGAHLREVAAQRVEEKKANAAAALEALSEAA